jgi:hypothetical protein
MDRNHRNRKKWTAAVALFGLIGAAQQAAFGWGNSGHTWINQVAAQKLPASMPKFLRTGSAVERIAYLGPEPDRWREAGSSALNVSQAPDHFIDLERIDGLGDLPRNRYDFYKALYAKRAATAEHADDYLPDRVGLQPYIAMEVMQRLEIAFRNYRELGEKKQKTAAVENDIIFYMGWLGHYVGDGSQPLHTTVNYDGWTGPNPNGYTTRHGIHSRFESDFVDHAATPNSFAGLVNAPQRVGDPFGDYQKYLWASHALIEPVYQFDKQHALDGAGTPDSVKFLNARLAAGSQMLLNLWYTAWLESGEPVPARNPPPAN